MHVQYYYCSTLNAKKIINKSLHGCKYWDAPPSSLMDLVVSPKKKIMEGKGVGARSLACSISKVEGRVGAPGWD